VLHAGAVLAYEGNGLGVEGYPAVLVGLGVLLAAEDPGTAEVDDLSVQVEPGEAQTAQLASAHAGGHGKPNEGAPVVVHLECALDYAAGFGG